MKATLIATLLGLAIGSGVQADEILIRGATVHTASPQGTLQNTDVLLKDGKITAVGQHLPSTSTTVVVEAHNRPLTPGLFGGLSTIGIEEVSGEPETVDARFGSSAPTWQQQWRPEFDVTLAYNPNSVVVPVARVEGLAWTVLKPRRGDTLMAGQGAAVSLDGHVDAVIPGSQSLFVSFGSSGASVSGGSRAAQYMFMQQAVAEAGDARPPGTGALLHTAGRKALARYLAGGRVIFAVDRAADIHRVIEFARQNAMHPIISGGSEAWMVAQELAQARVPVILDALQNLPDSFDQLGARLDNAALLHQAGVTITFSSGETHNAAKIRQLAGNAVAHGLPWEAALSALTAAPAEMFGIGASRGRIVPGQIADLVMWDADPLEVTSLADQVWIAGRAIEMRSRQTLLRDRYIARLKPSPAH